MEAYIDELKDERLAHELLIAIRGKRAFRRFKDTLIGYGMIQSWYDYEDQYYWKLARRWCIERNLEFTL